jgi:hypothetical protein
MSCSRRAIFSLGAAHDEKLVRILYSRGVER